MILDPDRIFLERPVLGEIVVVIGIAVMGMLEVEAIDWSSRVWLFGSASSPGGIAVSGCG